MKTFPIVFFFLSSIRFIWGKYNILLLQLLTEMPTLRAWSRETKYLGSYLDSDSYCLHDHKQATKRTCRTSTSFGFLIGKPGTIIVPVSEHRFENYEVLRLCLTHSR